MKLITRLSTILVAVFAVGLLAQPAAAQTTVTSTTLSAALSSTSATTMLVASATGFVANSTYALIDKELVGVRAINSTTISITRGYHGTRAATHLSGAQVYVGPVTAYQEYLPSGSCTRTNLLFVPWLVGGENPLYLNGAAFDCLGGQWYRTDEPGSGAGVIGATVASAGTITPTGMYTKVSGTAAIATVTVPAGLKVGMSITLEPTGIFTWTTGGNILIAGTAVVAKALILTWNGVKWVPSYVS